MAQLSRQKPTSTGRVRHLRELTEVEDEEIPKMLLTILLGQPYRHLATLWLFGAENTVVYNPKGTEESASLFFMETGRYVFKLPVGVYKLRVFIDGQFTDNFVMMDRAKTCVIGEPEQYTPVRDQVLLPPDLYSAVPLAGKARYASSFDYYREAAVRISTDPTFDLQLSERPHAGMFIFLRYPSAEIFQKAFKSRAYWKRFALYDSNDDLLIRFPEGARTHSEDQPSWKKKHGYLGFSVLLKPGLYFLKYSGKEKRTVPIYVYPNWYTQVFMTLDQEPLFGSLKILIDGQLRFDPYEVLHTYVDVCLTKLQNQDYTLDRELLQTVANGKYSSPMLGLLGAFIYLMGTETKSDSLFKTIVRNLQERILANSSDSPDIYALNFLSYGHFRTTLGPEVRVKIGGTPMLRVAYDVLRQAATRYDWIVMPGSLNDRIAESQFFDAPFNTFTSIDISKSDGNSDDEFEAFKRYGATRKYESYWAGQRRYLLYGDLLEKLLQEEPLSGREDLVRSDDLSVDDATVEETPSKAAKEIESGYQKLHSEKRLKKLLHNPKRIGRVGAQVIQIVLEKKGISSNKIAQMLQMPIATVARLRNKYNIYL